MDPGTLSAIQGFAAIALILVGVATALTGLRWVWLRSGRPKAVEGPASGEWRDSMGRLEENEHRLAELEERLDFAERMLAQAKPDSALPPGRS